jgi:hypothetical protein
VREGRQEGLLFVNKKKQKNFDLLGHWQWVARAASHLIESGGIPKSVLI